MNLQELIESDSDKTILIIHKDLQVTRFANGVLNLMSDNEYELNQAQFNQFKDDLIELGYKEKESWIGTQGASWLSSGVFAGVSMTVIRSAE